MKRLFIFLVCVTLTAACAKTADKEASKSSSENSRESSSETSPEISHEKQLTINSETLKIGDEVPINEFFLGITLPAAISDIKRDYKITNVISFSEGSGVSSSFYYDNFLIVLRAENISGVEVDENFRVKDDSVIYFDENTVVLVQNPDFTDFLLDELDSLGKVSVEELLQKMFSHKRVTDVQVFDGDTQITDGELREGMIIKVFYDEASWLEYPVIGK